MLYKIVIFYIYESKYSNIEIIWWYWIYIKYIQCSTQQNYVYSHHRYIYLIFIFKLKKPQIYNE